MRIRRSQGDVTKSRGVKTIHLTYRRWSGGRLLSFVPTILTGSVARIPAEAKNEQKTLRNKPQGGAAAENEETERNENQTCEANPALVRNRPRRSQYVSAPS